MFQTYLVDKTSWGEVDWTLQEIELIKGVVAVSLWLPQVKSASYPLRTELAVSIEQKGKWPRRRVGIDASLGIYRGEEAAPISRPTMWLQLDELPPDLSTGGVWELRALRALLFDDDLRWVPSVAIKSGEGAELILLNDKLYPEWTRYNYPVIGLHIIRGRCLASWSTMLWWDMWGKWRFLREGGLPPGTGRK